MKAIIALVMIAASATSASALTSKYTSELEHYTSASKAAKLSEADVKLALTVISSDRSESEKRAYIRSLVK